jgi:release factor glutamine methyltransferase
VLDLCTGSGCVAITLAKERPTNAVLGTDVSSEAHRAVARDNAQRLGALPAVSFRTSDLFADLGEGAGPFDLITANPPYIPETDRASLPLTITGFEPHVALFGGQDGLDVTARIVHEAPAHLAAGGVLAMELGEGQPSAVADRMRARGFEDVEIRRDYAGIERIVSGRWPGASER